MSVKDHGKGDYSQGRREQHSYSWKERKEYPEKTATRPQNRFYTSDSDERRLTAHRHEIALLHLEEWRTHFLKSFEIRLALASPTRDASQNLLVYFRGCKIWLVLEPDLQLFESLAIFEAATKAFDDFAKRGGRSWRFSPYHYKAILMESDALQEMFPSMTVVLEFRQPQFVPSLIEREDHRITGESETGIPKSIDRRVVRNLKYWRLVHLPRSQKEDIGSTNIVGSEIPTEGEHNVVDSPGICHRLIAEWKTRAGRKKDWSGISIRDLPKKDNLRGRERYKGRYAPFRTVNWLGHNILPMNLFTAASLYEIPRYMLRSYRHNSAQSGLRALVHLQRGSKRKLKSYDHKKKPRYLDLPRKSKRDHASDIKETIAEGISLLQIAGHSDSEAVDTGVVTDDCQLNCPQTNGVLPPNSLVLSIPYESHIGAIVGGRFILRGLISTKTCYDVHTANDLCTETVYTAKVYSIRGTKGKERKYRLTSLKRNASKASFIASLDQGGRKWLFFAGAIEHAAETGCSNDAFAWYGEEQYQHHFPVFSSRCTIAYTSPRKSYASCLQAALSESKETNCVQEVSSNSDDRIAKRKEKARDRQRNKRKQKRAAEAAARRATDNEPAVPEQTRTPADENLFESISRADPESILRFNRLSEDANFSEFLGYLLDKLQEARNDQVDADIDMLSEKIMTIKMIWENV